MYTVAINAHHVLLFINYGVCLNLFVTEESIVTCYCLKELFVIFRLVDCNIHRFIQHHRLSKKIGEALKVEFEHLVAILPQLMVVSVVHLSQKEFRADVLASLDMRTGMF